MNYSVSVLGILIGFTGGSLLLGHPIAAALGRATVVWDASSCPAGNYQIEATATHAGNGRTFEFRSSAVLPRSEVRAEFNDVPDGHYTVRVNVRRGDGLAFSASHTARVGTGGSDPAVDSSVRTSGSREITGLARPRGAATTASGATRAPGIAPPTPKRPPPSSPTRYQPAPETTLPELKSFLAMLRELAETGHEWTRLAVIDTDGDGEPDALTVELARGGALTVVWR